MQDQEVFVRHTAIKTPQPYIKLESRAIIVKMIGWSLTTDYNKRKLFHRLAKNISAMIYVGLTPIWTRKVDETTSVCDYLFCGRPYKGRAMLTVDTTIISPAHNPFSLIHKGVNISHEIQQKSLTQLTWPHSPIILLNVVYFNFSDHSIPTDFTFFYIFPFKKNKLSKQWPQGITAWMTNVVAVSLKTELVPAEINSLEDRK